MASDVPEGFAEALLVLAEATGARLTEARIRSYWLLLRDVQVPDFQRACYRCARERDPRFLPADLDARLPTVAELMSYLQPSESDAAVLAWTALQRAAEEVGAYSSLELSDPAAVFALSAATGGWPQFCALEDGPQLGQARQAFLAAYRQARRAGAPVLARLPGLCEQQGQYDGGPAVWVGRVTERWGVEVRRDRPQLGPAGHGNILTDGGDA